VWINFNPLPANVTFSNCDKSTSDSNSTDVSDYHIHKEHLQIISIREELRIAINQLSDNAHFSIRDNFIIASNLTVTHLIKKCVGIDINLQMQIWALKTVDTFPQQLSPVDQTSDPELERDG
jgi:hypothetical protein